MNDFVDKWLNNATKHQEFIDQMAEHWKNKNINVDIKDMYSNLSACGCRFSDLIIQKEKYINRYIELQNEGKSDLEIACSLDVEVERDI